VTTRQERRGQRRVLMKHGHTALRQGLAAVPPKSLLVGLGLLLRETLAGRQHPNPASRAAEIVHQVFEASLAQTPAKLAIACRKGCGYCCHNWVGATAPEVFLIARQLLARIDADWLAPQAVMLRADSKIGLDIAARFGKKLPCAFLADNACAIYAVRPTVCRQVTSTSLATCIEEFVGEGLGGDIMVSRAYLDHARNCRLPLLAALTAAGLPSQTYELSAAITRVLQTSGAEARWLAGEDVFADIAVAPAEPPAVGQAIKVIAAEITEWI
jgi:Fe-S-cluster containining protein